MATIRHQDRGLPWRELKDPSWEDMRRWFMEFSNVLVLDVSGGYMGMAIIPIITEISPHDLCTSLNSILRYKNNNEQGHRGMRDTQK